MKKKSLILFLVPILIVYISGCTTGGSFLAHNVTNVELSDANFNIVAKNIVGHSKASYILGITYSAGSVSNTLAIARIGGTSQLYNAAIQNLWKKFEAEYGDTEGKNLVLANIRIDNDMLNFLVYTQSELFVTADVIEFEE